MSFGRFTSAIVIAATIPFLGPTAKAQTAPRYHIVKTVPLGTPDRWDYLLFDSSLDRVYVSHGDRVTVVDAKSGKIIGNIADIPGGTHGIAISVATGKGFTDDGRVGEAVVFNLKTLKITGHIKADEDADGIAFDPASDHVFVVDGDPGEITVIDAKSGKVVATVHAGSKLEFAVAGQDGKIYVNSVEKSEIIRVDIATNKVDAQWPMPGCRSPHGLAIDPVRHILFSTCSNGKAVLMNAGTGKVITTEPIGQGSDAARFDPVHKLFFSSNFDGTLSIIAEKSADTFKELPPVKTALGARTMAIDPQTGRIFMTTADYKVNRSALATDRRHRYTVVPDSTKLLILDR